MSEVEEVGTPRTGRTLRRRPSTRTPQIEPKWVKKGGKVPTGLCYVGIDLSLAKTGVVALSEDASYYYWRLHKPPPSLSEVARLAAHRWMLADFFAEIGAPIWMGMEGYSFGSKGSSVFQIAQWGGVARLAIYDLGLDDRTIYVAPSTLKKFATNNGNAPKNLVLRDVYRIWGVEAEDDNVADAYVLAQAVMTYHTGNARYAWQRDALRRLGSPDGSPAEH